MRCEKCEKFMGIILSICNSFSPIFWPNLIKFNQKREEGGTLTVSFIVWLLKIRLHLISMEQSTLIDCDLRSDIELTYFCWCKFELDCHWTYMFLLMFSFHENCNKMDDSIFIQFGHKFEMHGRGFYSLSGCLAKQIVLNNDTTTICLFV